MFASCVNYTQYGSEFQQEKDFKKQWYLSGKMTDRARQGFRVHALHGLRV
jgi:hypothetical protein